MNSRYEKINIRVSAIEKELIETRAFHARKNISDYCRSILVEAENREINREHLLFRLSQLDDIEKQLKLLNEKSIQGVDDDILIEILLHLRYASSAEAKRIISPELKRLGRKAWDNTKKQPKE